MRLFWQSQVAWQHGHTLAGESCQAYGYFPFIPVELSYRRAMASISILGYLFMKTGLVCCIVSVSKESRSEGLRGKIQ